MALRRSPPPPRVPAHCPPGWAWLLAGILIGIFLSFLWYLREIAPNIPLPINNLTGPATTRVAPPAPTPTPSTPVASTTPPATTAPRFEFYDVLPANGKPVAKPAQAAQTPPAPTPQTPAPRPAAPVMGNYALQVASFRDSNSAEALKVHLSGLGIAAFVLPVTLNNGDTWYRVRAGAFQDANQATQARGQLLNHGFAADVVRNQ